MTRMILNAGVQLLNGLDPLQRLLQPLARWIQLHNLRPLTGNKILMK